MYDAEADSADDDDYDASLESSEREKDLGTPVQELLFKSSQN